jgi:hypothetical protein
LLSWDPDDALTSGPVSFTLDGESLYLLDSRGSNAAPLVQFEIASGKTNVIARDNQYDVSDVTLHPDTYEVQLVSFVKARVEHRVLDEAIKPDVEAISQLNAGDFGIYNRTHDDNQWLVGFTQDDRPFSYYAYDRRNKKGTFLFYNRPDLAEYRRGTGSPSMDTSTFHQAVRNRTYRWC